MSPLAGLGDWVVLGSSPLAFAADDGVTFTHDDNDDTWDISVEGDDAGSVGTLDDAEVWVETHQD